MFSTLPKPNFKFQLTFILLSANAFSLDQSKILLLGKQLKKKKIRKKRYYFLPAFTFLIIEPTVFLFRAIIIWYYLLNPFPNKAWFLQVCSTSLWKTLWKKEKLLITSNFSFYHSVFYLSGELSAIFIQFKIVFYKLFQFGRVWNL